MVPLNTPRSLQRNQKVLFFSAQVLRLGLLFILFFLVFFGPLK